MPRVDNPLAFMQELVGDDLLSSLQEIAAAQMDDSHCQCIRAWNQAREDKVSEDVPTHLRELHRINQRSITASITETCRCGVGG